MWVNKRELCRVLGCSFPTLDAKIAKHGAAFPVVERGTHGREWKFDPSEVLAFLGSIEEAEAAAAAQRDEAINQLALPIGHNGGPALDSPYPAPLRPAELLVLAKLRKLRREEEYECRRLVRVADVQRSLEDALALSGRMFRDMAQRFGQQRGWTKEETSALVEAVADWQRAFVREMQAATGQQEPQPEFDLAVRPGAA